MRSLNNGELIVGLDIGTSKIVAIVGEIKEDGEIVVIGLGHYQTRGLKRGVVVNIDDTVNSISRAIEDAELMAGCEIKKVYVSIDGEHISSLSSHGIVAIKNGEVYQTDIDRVMDAAKAVVIPANQKLLHTIPREFIIDQQGDVRDPMGMSGVRLEANVHLINCAEFAKQNIEKCVTKCGLQLEDIVLNSLASSHSVLTQDEKDLGVCLVDIGGGTSGIIVFAQGSIRHACVIPIAGEQVTNDIAAALRTPTIDAENLKTKYACALSQLVKADETIQVPGIGDRKSRKLDRQALAEVVEPRYEEIFTFIRQELERGGFDENLTGGVVLTGGTAKMEGARELAEEIFNMPVRLGVPTGVQGLGEIISNPIYSAGVGLLLYGRQVKQMENEIEEMRKKQRDVSTFDSIVQWFKNQF